MKKNKVLVVIRIVIALIVWFLIYKSYSTFVDPMLDGKLPDVIRLIIRSMIVPYTVALGACYLIIRGMEVSCEYGGGTSGVLENEIQKISVTPGFIIKAFLIQTGLSMPVILICNIILTILGVTPHGMTAEEIFGKNYLFYIILLLGFAPAMEELIFRKLFLDRLLVIGEAGAIIISAVLFGLPHAFSQGIPQMLGTFIIGIVWAYVRIKTGRLWPGIILHIMFNLYGSYFALFMSKIPITTVIFMFMSVIIIPIIASVLLITHFSSAKLKHQA